MNAQRSVLVVDRSEDVREVLEAALEPRGVQIFAAQHPERGLQLARELQPDVIILDAEFNDSPPEAIYEPFAQQAHDHATPLVVLGGVWRHKPDPLAGEFIAKPYHYAPLIRKIEALLHTAGRTV